MIESIYLALRMLGSLGSLNLNHVVAAMFPRPI